MSQPKIFEDKEYCHSRKELYMDSTGQYRPRQSKSLGRPFDTTTYYPNESRQWHSAGSSRLDQQPKYRSIKVEERRHDSITPVTETTKPLSIRQSITPLPHSEVYTKTPVYKSVVPPTQTYVSESKAIPLSAPYQINGESKYSVLPKPKPTYSKLKDGTLIHEIEEVQNENVESDQIKSDQNINRNKQSHVISQCDQKIYEKKPYTEFNGSYQVYSKYSPIDKKEPTGHKYGIYDKTKYSVPYELSPSKELKNIPLSTRGVQSYQDRTKPIESTYYKPQERKERDEDIIYTTKDISTRQVKEPKTNYYIAEPIKTYYTKEPTKYYRQRSPSLKKVVEEEYTRHYKKTETTDEIIRETTPISESYYEGDIKEQNGYYKKTTGLPNVGVTTHYTKQQPSRSVSRNTINFEDSSDTEHYQKTKSFKSFKKAEKRVGSPERIIDEGAIYSTSDGFKIILDTSHFHSNDVKITKYDHTLQLEGKHYEVDRATNDTVTRSFVRKYSIPSNIDMNSISATVNEKGIMTIVGYYKKNDNHHGEKSVIYKL